MRIVTSAAVLTGTVLALGACRVSTRTVDVTQDPAAPHHVRATANSGDVTVTKN
jgi:hypothetical protein